MEWSKLDLKKASVLRKEVDNALRLITQAVEKDDQNTLELLIQSIKLRSNEIEEFYAQNEDDDRAILFEKQRLRLRRSIQGLLPDSPIKGPVTPGIPNTPEIHPNQQQQQQQQQQQTLLSQQTTNPTPKRPSPTRSLGGSSVQSNNSKLNTKKKQSNPAHPPPMRAGSISTLKSPHPSASTLLQTQSPAISKKPLYSWEVASDFDDSEASSGYYPAVLRERIYTVDYGSFIPSDKRGVYIRENNETDELDNNSEYSDFPHTPYLSKQSSTSPLKRSTSYTSPSPNSPHTTNTPQGYLDVQIVFSENEFNAFILRKNLTLKNKNFKSKIILEKHASKYTDAKCKESKFLRTQTPYIDNKRILKELYRPEQPNKWIDNKGFQLTNTRIEID
mmetsp:Transcript_1758/g.1767  ORF Transcript_1758/g.1767 Transcript_1758/m.1767 type:complete len:389 (+) Transcript_1758:35-1201(+)